MDQYTELLESVGYVDFIIENAQYAQARQYDVSTPQGVAKAVNERFLFDQFLAEAIGV